MKTSVVRSAIPVGLGALVLFGFGYVGGAAIERQIDRLEAALAELPGVRVERMDYARGLWGGVLDYTLRYSPPADSLIAEMMQAMGLPDITLSGQADIRHGPFPGGGPALAAIDWEIAMPPDLAATLHALEAGTPLARGASILGFDGVLRTELASVTYDAPYDPGEGTQGRLAFAGLTAGLEFDMDLDRIAGSMAMGGLRIDTEGADPGVLEVEPASARFGLTRDPNRLWSLELALDVPGILFDLETDQFDLAGLRVALETGGTDQRFVKVDAAVEGVALIALEAGAIFTLALDGYRLSADLIEVARSVYVGDARFEMDRLEAKTPEGDFRLIGMVVAGSGTETDGRIDSSFRTGFGRLDLFDHPLLGQTELVLSTNNVPVEPLARLNSLLEEMPGAGPLGDGDPLGAEIGAALLDILASGTRINLERLSIGLADPEDIRLSASLGFPAGAPIDPADPAAMLGALEAVAQFRAARPALAALVGRVTRIQAEAAARFLGLPATAEAIERDTARALEMLEATLAELPLLEVGPDTVSSRIALADGMISVNDQAPVPVGMFVMEMMAAGLALSESVGGFGAPEGLRPDAAPAIGQIPATAGMRPDAWDFEMDGTVPVPDGLGMDCRGFVHEGAPDFRIDVAPGIGTLELRVNAERDTVLLVMAPDGVWHCNDDFDGVDPRVAIADPAPGPYAVWIATFSAGPAEGRLTVAVEADDDAFGFSGPAPDSGPLDPEAGPRFGWLGHAAGGSAPDAAIDFTLTGSLPVPEGLGPDCVGHAHGPGPDLTIDLGAGVAPFGLFVEAEADTALVVLDPAGRWLCNDDFDGLDPGLFIDAPLSGPYRVWITTFGAAVSTEGTLFVEPLQPETDAVALDWMQAPRQHELRLSSGFSPERLGLPVAVEGLVAVDPALGPDCVGHVTGAAPDVTVDFAPGARPLTIYGESGGDLTLVIRDPLGRWFCNDDAHGSLNPAVTIPDPAAGRYAIWVGSFGTGMIDGTLNITEGSHPAQMDSVALDWTDPPRVKLIGLADGFEPDPATLAFVAGGGAAAISPDIGCFGHVAGAAPDVVLDYDANGGELTVFFESATDTTLMVRTPSGRWLCNDDSMDGMDPLVTIAQPETGTYAIWVGSHAPGQAEGQLSITGEARSTRLDAGLSPRIQRMSLQAGFMPDPVEIPVPVEGTLEIPREAGFDCRGYASSHEPDVTLDFGGSDRTLYLYASSGGDLTLAVRLPDGSLVCNDDSVRGLDPMVSLDAPEAGAYAIWVGNYRPSREQAVLGITEIAYAPAPGRALDRDPGVAPRLETIAVPAEGSPIVRDFAIAPGLDLGQELSAMGCVGVVSDAAPDYILVVPDGAPLLHVSAESETDTTLAVLTPDGRWVCNDDWFGLNPMVTLEPGTPGHYRIWIGSWDGAAAEGQIRIATTPPG